ncbi:hypothetical protein DNI29_23345 [Hymenobacter sediminis]|uniref:hypothetical protein n=1 Tax=Hymenobacter sediminis TaxID=2218621 RepID=UPI000F5060BE|nr:hypothetical protein [Hymenobacter sediminis]RPD43675.1 hypothetical protein DNI29_23345 [Hymenobacter sediminis]
MLPSHKLEAAYRSSCLSKASHFPNAACAAVSRLWPMHISTSEPEGKRTLFPRQHVRRQVGKALGHLVPAGILALGVGPLFSGAEPFTLLAGVEVVVGLTYLVLMVRELRHLRQHPLHQKPIAWLELAAAAILALESYHLWHRHHATQVAGAPPRTHVLPWLYALVALLYVGLAFSLQWVTQRRYLHLHAEGLSLRTGLFSPVHRVRWADLAAVEPVGPSGVRLRYRDGREYDLDFAGFRQGAAHRDHLLAHAHTARIGQA